MACELRNLCLTDFPGENHTTGFAANGTAADHPVAEQKIVIRSEILPDQLFQPLVFCHGAVDDLFLGIFAEDSPGIFHFCQIKETVVAVVILVRMI